MKITTIIQKTYDFVEELASEYNDDKKYPDLESEIEYGVLEKYIENDNQYAIYKFWLFGNIQKLYKHFDEIVSQNYEDAISSEADMKMLMSYY